MMLAEGTTRIDVVDDDEHGGRHACRWTRSPADRAAATRTPRAGLGRPTAGRRRGDDDQPADRWPPAGRSSRTSSTRRTASVQNKQFCASWFFDNFSSRFEPRLIEHIELTAIAVGIGMVIAFTAAILAYKLDWFETPFSLLVGVPVHDPEPRPVRAAGPDHRDQPHHRRDRARLLHAADPVPQHAHRPARRAAGRRSRPLARWASPNASNCSGSSCRSRCRRSWPGSGSRR